MQSWTLSTTFSLAITLEIDTNALPACVLLCQYTHTNTHTHYVYCSVVSETLPAISQMIWWSSSPESTRSAFSPVHVLCENLQVNKCLWTGSTNCFWPLGPVSFLRWNRLTATTISKVSALVLPKSQLHLDYYIADITALELFSI